VKVTRLFACTSDTHNRLLC